MKRIIFLSACVMTISIMSSCTSKQEKMEKRLKDFISAYEKNIVPLSCEASLASWNANVNGSDENWKLSEKASFAFQKAFTDPEAFKELKAIKESGAVKDPLLVRELDRIFNYYLAGQVDTTLIAEQIRMETEISKKYSNFRAELAGKQVSDNEIDDILRNSKDNANLQAAWEAHKLIGPVVADDIIKLVKHRNVIARNLGFNNYHEMSLKLSGQDPEEVTRVFDELDSLTRGNFVELKGEIDSYYAKRYGISVAELRPWHYQNRFFQETPEIYPVNFDKYYEKQDPVKLASQFYSGLGLDVTKILAQSDLYEKPGKNQHAFSTDINRSGDVRTLDNIRPDSYWMNTILHELGHGVYSYYNDPTLPWELRDAAHTFTTEAIANMFGRLATDPQWMCDMGIIDAKERDRISEDSYKALRLQQLVFSRWAQVMYRFEKSMYENPDQDLNQLWWNTVEKYQMLTKPEGRNMPDWASKIHIALYPCYYHNYLLGEMLASQFYCYMTTNVTKVTSLVGQTSVGDYLKKNVFYPGARYYWNDMIEKATGEKLTAKYYAKQFVK
jgi:peptidyl-dipeptidase A